MLTPIPSKFRKAVASRDERSPAGRPMGVHISLSLIFAGSLENARIRGDGVNRRAEKLRTSFVLEEIDEGAARTFEEGALYILARLAERLLDVALDDVLSASSSSASVLGWSVCSSITAALSPPLKSPSVRVIVP